MWYWIGCLSDDDVGIAGVSVGRICRRLLIVSACLLSIFLSIRSVTAAVTIAGFEVEPGEAEIFVYWETASEIDNLGFYVWRSEDATGDYKRLPIGKPESEQFIPSEDLGFGAFYEFVDEQVESGIRYYYKVQDFPASGSPEFVGPESAGIGLSEGTDTPTPTPTPTLATSTPMPTPTPRPNSPASTPTVDDVPSTEEMPQPRVDFWADATSIDAGDCTTVQWVTDNVASVFYDGGAVQGQGAMTVCPCEDERHILDVTYPDGSAESFTVRVSVSGSCPELSPSSPSSPLATPTFGPTRTPTATPEPTTAPTLTLSPVPTVRRSTSTPRPRQRTPVVSATPEATPTATATSADAAGALLPADGPDSLGAVEDDATSPTSPVQGRGVVVEGNTAGGSQMTTWLLALGALVGLGLVSVGIWFWRRG